MNITGPIHNAILLSSKELQSLSRIKVLYGTSQWKRTWRGNGLVPDDLFVKLRDEYTRRQTFLQLEWKETFVSIDDLAKYGFFYFGESDKVQCIFCLGVLGTWTEGDAVFSEHLRHFPSCPFMLNLPVGNIPIDPGFSTTVVRFSDEQRNTAVENSTIALQYGNYSADKSPVYIRFASFTARFASFEKWPESIPVDKELLTNAGFFYVEKNDSVQCFHCGGMLRKWSESTEPWVEHKKWFPKCNYLLKIDSLNIFADLVRTKKVDLDTRSISENDKKRIIAKLNHSSFREKRKRKKRDRGDFDEEGKMDLEENDDDDDPMDRKCKICLVKEIELCFLPCAHVVSCMSCAADLKACPICRRVFDTCLKIYMC